MNNKTQHTPGPWDIATSSNHVPRVIQKGKPGFIAQMGFPSDGEREANARLIAAAPEMLNLLRVLSRIFNDSNFTDRGGYGESIDCLIAKAEGRAE